MRLENCLALRAERTGARLGIALLALVAIVACNVSTGFGSTKEFRAKQAARLVQEALNREINGLNQERDALLNDALRQLPNFAPAMWHRGFVRMGKRWVRVNETAELAERNKQLEQYKLIRQQVAATGEGQLALANWCRSRGLFEQERAHLTRALDFAPDNSQILSRLGFRSVAGNWVSGTQLEQSARETAARRKNLATWMPRLERIRQNLRQRSLLKREAAAKQLSAINDPSAIPALERLAGDSDEAAAVVVQALDGISDHNATLSLARIAVYADASEVRQAAAQSLKNRNRDDYVPELLAAMQTQINSRTVAFRDGGKIRFLHSYVREQQDERQQVVLKTRSSQRPNSIVQQNGHTQMLNERITEALNTATGQSLKASPQVWWKWWNDTNEVFIEGEKPVQASGFVDQLARVDRAREFEEQRRIRQAAEKAQREEQERQRQLSRARGRTPQRRDCLAPGTLVWTFAGPMAVESIQVGDLVLAQNPETGELAFKPVLRTTLRPQTTLVKITAGSETIEASGGHPFWVAGKGWVKARDLKSGMELHGVTSTMTITRLENGRNVQTHNLIVADFNTYFVGKEKVLSHDNTIRKSTNAIVPGLVK